MTILTPVKTISGCVEGIYANADPSDENIQTGPIERTVVTFNGMEEDRHASLVRKSDMRFRRQYAIGTLIRNTRQISILSVEELEVIAKMVGIPYLEPGWLGANLVLSGIPDMTMLPPSTRLLFTSGAALVVDNENRPCRYPGDVIESHHPGKGSRFASSAIGRRGLVAWVEKEGAIEIGDMVALHIPPQRFYAHAENINGRKAAKPDREGRTVDS